MKKTTFYMIISNSLIALMLLSLSVITFVDPVKSVVMQDALRVYYNGNTNNKNVSLMFNVYWGNEYLAPILNILKEEGIKTTFFVGGVWVDKYPELLLDIVADEHEIGNHGYFHKSHDELNYQQNQDEIFNNHKLVKQLINVDMNLFAPPSGAFNETTLQVAKNLGYSVIMWTKDTVDWRDADADIIYNRAIKNLKNGDLILMHPTKATTTALPNVIKQIKQNGYNIVNVSKNIHAT